MKVTVTSRSGKTIAVLKSLSPASTISEVQQELALAKPNLYPSRQRLTLRVNGKHEPLSPEKRLSDYNLLHDCEIECKDLGPQISWRTVFVLEYLGPMLVYPIFFFQPTIIYGVPNATPNYVQQLALGCFVLHYLKREYETFFVHRFGTGTMPIRNLFKNSSYYWGNALVCSYFINHPLYTTPSPLCVYLGLALFFIGEIGNFHAHLVLKNLRRPGTKERNIPRGGLFEFVSCANYTYEILAWVGWTTMVQSIAALLFTLQGGVQMLIWALAKHKRYRKEFNGAGNTPTYPAGRKALIPFII